MAQFHSFLALFGELGGFLGQGTFLFLVHIFTLAWPFS